MFLYDLSMSNEAAEKLLENVLTVNFAAAEALPDAVIDGRGAFCAGEHCQNSFEHFQAPFFPP